MSCWRSRRWLSAYIDGELPPGRKSKLEAHLVGCPACAAEERELRATWEELRSAPAPSVDADLWDGVVRGLARSSAPPPVPIRSRWLVPAAVGACALAGLAGGTLFALRFLRPPERPAVVVHSSSADDSFAEAFGDGPVESAMRGFFAAAPAAPSPAGPAGEDAR